MTDINKAKLRKYIEKVIDDACKAEERPNDVQFEAYVIDKSSLLLVINTKFMRVKRRIYYRISHNIQRHFGLTMVSIYKVIEVQHPDFIMEDDRVDAGYTVCDIKTNKGHYFIWASAIGNKSHLIPESIRSGNQDAITAFRNKLESVGGHLYYYDDLDNAFEAYKADYLAAFGNEPATVQYEQI